mgnify:CR=1 FL=1
MKINEFLQDSSGSFSSTRLAFLAWAFGSLVVWVWVSLTSSPPVLHPIPQEVIWILASLMAGKVWQKTIEEKEPTK